MNKFNNIRKKKIFEMLAIIKIIYMLLGVVAMIGSPKLIDVQNYMMMSTYFILITILVILYFIWLSKNQYKEIDNKAKSKDYIEAFLLILISTVVILATGKMDSPYKFLYIFIIIIATIQFGKTYAMKIAIICSIIVYGIDILSIYSMNGAIEYKEELLIIYFQIDIVMVAAFLVTAWILGMYVSIEKNHSSELQTLANVDELTGLYNHRYFQEYLEKSIELANDTKNVVTLLFMDIDYFKNYNDTNGHQAGDMLLKEIGIILKNSIRQSDVVARYGGEEFAVILPNTNEETAIKIGERIRTTIENTKFEGQDSQPNKSITISIGVSSYPHRSSTKHQLINTADDALYRAKSLNKNRVEVYYSVLEEICEHIFIEQETINSLKAFISMINKKDRYTYGHTERVVIYLGWFADYLKIGTEDKLKLKLSAYLHDIGKIEIPEEVLNKKSRLTNEEFEMLKAHPVLGVDLVKHIRPFQELLPLIRHHHERYDGTGYPDNLKGEEIPYLARMLTIADSFDAMTSHRPYNTRKSHEEAIVELKKCSGSQFDPELTDKFIQMLKKENDKKNI